MNYLISGITKRQRDRIPLLLRSVGIDHSQEPIRRPGGFPLWQILYGVSGSGEFRFDGGKSVLQPGQIAVLEPDVPHSYQGRGDSWVVHYLCFDGEGCTKILSCLRLNRPGIYSLSNPGLFLDHLEKLEQLASDVSPELFLCSVELYSMLLDLSDIVRRLPLSQAAEESGPAREIILYLEDHFDQDLSLDDLGAHFHKTPEYLCTSFKSATGETIMHYLRRVRIHHARILLMEQPDAGIREISRRCGFSSVSYFGRVFREITGYTPQGYRLGSGTQHRSTVPGTGDDR
ncbi:MAG: AraC family transcriptional regulator [Lachnospiraceae bacterium]|nr:AraC family transcriptional regulator [Lachnospiraceae bacterium]MCH4063959.1 AraC family transcriptional regulator [Lachnospiraceae bacterium]MCH4103319.1 AraC family transcriptional regulator [Lachnospiraceae bacterium]